MREGIVIWEIFGLEKRTGLLPIDECEKFVDYLSRWAGVVSCRVFSIEPVKSVSRRGAETREKVGERYDKQ